jgi:hypothetical protein
MSDINVKHPTMRISLLSLIMLIFLCLNLNGQTVITGIVTDSLNKPISSASVYLSKTTFGILTDDHGAYALNIKQDGIYELIASYIGYKTFSQFISTKNNRQVINIKLTPNMVVLDEVSVTSRDKNRLANYSRFVKLFMGETSNSGYCRILNPEDLHLYRDDKTNTLNGFSVKPLKIENRALGYSMLYDLTDFKYNSESGMLRFRGNHYFQTLGGSHRDSIKWNKNRLTAYYGSRMHLFRSIFSDSLFSENYRIFECRIDSTTGEFTIIKPLTERDLTISKNIDYLTLQYKNPVLVNYTDNHPELATGLTGFNARKVISTLVFNDFINVYRNGYFDNPYSIIWGGEMIIERVADMLPYDFEPDNTANTSMHPDANLSPVEKYLFSEQKKSCSDQVFVQTDRNIYAPDDTIYFQAYIRDRHTNRIESKSSSLYAMLFDDKRAITDSSRFRIINSGSSGWLAIPSKAKTGIYHLAAFTGQMQNFDPAEAFQTDLFIKEKIYSPEIIEAHFSKNNYMPGDTIEANVKISTANGEPVRQQRFQYSLVTGNNSLNTAESHTNRKGESVIKFIIPDSVINQPRLLLLTNKTVDKASQEEDFSIPFANRYFELRFLPEGGTLISGPEQRIGFNATDFKGEPVSITGLLKTSSGQVIDTIKSGAYGPGSFSCKPESGLYVELLNGAGIQNKWPLPEPSIKGKCLSVRHIDPRSFAIEIQSTDYNGDTVLITGVVNGNQILSQEICMDKRQRIVVQTDQLPAGTAQITLFTKDLKPLAERLVFVNSDKHLRFNIKPSYDKYGAGQETELAVSVTDGRGEPVEGIFSMAIVDSLSAFSPEIFTPGIEYTFNYNPVFPGNLPARVLINGLENLSDNDLDLILMVYGWCKYNWDFSSNKASIKEPANYDLLKMKILYASKLNRSDRRLDLVSLEGPSIKHLITNGKGEISLPLDSLPDITRSVTMMPDTKNKKRVTGAMLSIPYNEKYFKSNKLFLTGQYIDPEVFNKTSYEKATNWGDSLIEIPSVSIKGHSETKKVYHDKYEEEYQYASVRSLDPIPLWSSFSLESAIRKLVEPYSISEKYVILRPPFSMIGGGLPAVFVLDGLNLPLQAGWEQVKTISPYDLSSLTILFGSRGTTKYGMDAAGGVIFVNTYVRNPGLMDLRLKWMQQNKNDKMLIPIGIFRAEKEFYVPTKLEINNDPVIQRRSTILWKSDVYFNGKDPVKMKYINLKRRGPAIITINGVSTNNLVGSGRSRYIVN